MNTTDTNTTGTLRRRLAAIAIAAGMALSFAAAFAALQAEPNATGDGIFAWISDYVTAVGDVLVGG